MSSTPKPLTSQENAPRFTMTGGFPNIPTSSQGSSPSTPKVSPPGSPRVLPSLVGNADVVQVAPTTPSKGSAQPSALFPASPTTPSKGSAQPSALFPAAPTTPSKGSAQPSALFPTSPTTPSKGSAQPSALFPAASTTPKPSLFGGLSTNSPSKVPVGSSLSSLLNIGTPAPQAPQAPPSSLFPPAQPAPSTQQSLFQPAPSTQQSLFPPSQPAQQSLFQPAPSTQQSLFQPAPPAQQTVVPIGIPSVSPFTQQATQALPQSPRSSLESLISQGKLTRDKVDVLKKVGYTDDKILDKLKNPSQDDPQLDTVYRRASDYLEKVAVMQEVDSLGFRSIANSLKDHFSTLSVDEFRKILEDARGRKWLWGILTSLSTMLPGSIDWNVYAPMKTSQIYATLVDLSSRSNPPMTFPELLQKLNYTVQAPDYFYSKSERPSSPSRQSSQTWTTPQSPSLFSQLAGGSAPVQPVVMQPAPVQPAAMPVVTVHSVPDQLKKLMVDKGLDRARAVISTLTGVQDVNNKQKVPDDKLFDHIDAEIIVPMRKHSGDNIVGDFLKAIEDKLNIEVAVAVTTKNLEQYIKIAEKEGKRGVLIGEVKQAFNGMSPELQQQVYSYLDQISGWDLEGFGNGLMSIFAQAGTDEALKILLAKLSTTF